VQHTEFNKHFHVTADNFKAQKSRDKIKEEWCHLEDVSLVCVHHNEIPIEVPALLKKIEDAQHGP